MFDLTTLGSVDLRGPDGEAIQPVLSQPKRLALLVYLATAHRGSFCTREKLLALFWPETFESRARNSLSQSLSFLRHHLAPELIITRGPEDVGLDPDLISSDVAAFEYAVDEGNWGEASDVYRGDLLSGFHVDGGSGFDEWLESERGRLKAMAGRAAWSLAQEQVDRGALVEAVRTAHRALELAWTEAAPVRDFVRGLANVGDRAAAISFYERFCGKLRHELEIEPSQADIQFLEEIRNGDMGSGPGAESEGSGRNGPVSFQASGEESDGDAQDPPGTQGPPGSVARVGSPMLRRRIWIPGAALLTTAALYFGLIRGSGPQPVEAGNEVVVVIPFSNRTGDPELDYVGTLAAMGVSDALNRSGLANAVPWQNVDASWRAVIGQNRDVLPREPMVSVAEEYGADIVIMGSLSSQPGGFRLEAEIVEADGWDGSQGIGPVSVPADSVGAGVEVVGQRVIASLALRRDWPHSAPYMSPMPSIGVVQDYLEAYAGGTGRDWDRALPLVESALRQDSTYLPARLLHAVIQLNLGNFQAVDSILDDLGEVYDQMPLFERASWQWTRAALDGDREGVYWAAKDYSERVPGNIAVYTHGFEAKRLNRPREAVEVLSRLSSRIEYVGRVPGYWYHMGDALHMLGEHARELREVHRGRSFMPDNGDLIYAEIRALVGLGQVEGVRALVEEAFHKSVTTSPVVRVVPNPPGPGTVLQVAANELKTHEHTEAFEDLQEWGMDLMASELDDSGSPPEARLQQLLVLYALEEWDRAQALARELAGTEPSMIIPVAYLGTLAAREGDRATATRISEELRDWDDPYIRGANTYHRARIAALLGDRAEAVRLLRQAHEEGNSFSSDLLGDPDLMSLRDYPPFEAFITPIG